VVAGVTGGGADGIGGVGGGRETRAVEAVHSQPVFRTPVMARAESQSGRVAQRWAPEGQAERARRRCARSASPIASS
jgi:hypothetical protein